MTTSPVLLTEKESADLMRISPKTLQAWRTSGGGPAFTKVGRAVRYSRDTIESWLRSRERHNTSLAGAGEIHTR